MAADWSKLPEDLLISLAKRLLSFEHIVAFGAVCASWRRAAVPAKEAFEQLSWLMTLCDKKGSGSSRRCLEISSLSRRKTYLLPLPRQARDAKAVLSSLGWILTTSYSSNEVNLFNFLSRAEIRLPNLSNISSGIVKFVLSASPSRGSEDYKVIVLHDDENPGLNKSGLGFMAFWKPGNLAWTRVGAENVSGVYSDMAYRDGLVYAIDILGLKVVVLNIEEDDRRYRRNTTIKTVTVVSRLKAPERSALWQLGSESRTLYVVESEGVLLAVRAERRFLTHCPTETVAFRVYKWCERGGVFERLSSLGDRALFLGDSSSSFAVKASDYAGCEANCIYFADNFRRLRNTRVSDGDVGVFRLEDGTFKRCFRVGNRGCLSPPLWVQPTLTF